MPAIAQAIFGTVSDCPKARPQCPNVTDITLEAGEGPLCSVGSYYPERGLRAGPRRLHYRTQGQPVRTLQHRECLSKRPLFDKYNCRPPFRDIRKSTTNKISTPPSKSGTCFRRRYSTKPVSGSCGLTCLDGGRRPQRTTNALDPGPRQAVYVALLPAVGLRKLVRCPRIQASDVMNRFSVGDDVTMTLGAHTLHFGATFTRVQTNDLWFRLFRRLSGFSQT